MAFYLPSKKGKKDMLLEKVRTGPYETFSNELISMDMAVLAY